MSELLSGTQQNIYNTYLAQSKATGGCFDESKTLLVWGDDGSLTATEDDGDVFVFSADGTLISQTEGKNHKPLADGAEGSASGNMQINGKDKESVIAELLQKYSASNSGGDPYSMNNAQLKAFQQAVNDGLIAALDKAGYNRNDIVEIISGAFSSIGINPSGNGGYTLPYGHDEESKALYEEVNKQLSAVSSTTPEIEALKDKISGLQAQIESSNKQIKLLTSKIEKIKEEIEEQIKKAIEESDEIAEEQKKKAEDILAEELNRYTNAKGSMSYEEFQGNLTERLNALDSSGQSKLSAVMTKLLNAENKMTLLNGYLTTMGGIINTNKGLESQVAASSEKLNQLEEEAKNNPDCNGNECQRTDPIGFTANGKKFDFFLDKDGDSKLSNEQEFLGAQDGWNEMSALDTDKDGKVDKEELAAANLKVVVTDKDGNQTIQDASELFGEDDTVNLNSFKELNHDMENGNTLLGTFNLTMSGKNVDTGYNTLDRLDWLDANYEFSDKDRGINRFAKGDEKTTTNAGTDFSSLLDRFKEDYKNLEAQIKNGWMKINIDRDSVADSLSENIRAEAQAEGQKIDAEFKEFAKKEKEK